MTPDRRGLAGRLEHEPAERHEQEPVAAERDHRGEEQPAEIPVAPQQVDGRLARPSRARRSSSLMACQTTWRRRSRRVAMLERSHVVPAVGVPLGGRRAHDLHRSVGNARGRAARRRHPHHARAPRPLPARGDRAAVDAVDEARVAPHDVGDGAHAATSRPSRPAESHEVGGLRFDDRARVQHPRGGAGLPPEGEPLGRLRARARRQRPTTTRATPTTRPSSSDVRTDVAFLPIGGHYTMNAEEAAGLAQAIGPRLAVPMHFGFVVGSAVGRRAVPRGGRAGPGRAA